MDVEKVKPLLRAVVQSNKGGVAAHRFNGTVMTSDLSRGRQ